MRKTSKREIFFQKFEYRIDSLVDLMRAVTINNFGDENTLNYSEEVPIPDFAPNQVLIKTYAASVNPLDIRIRNGDLSLLMGSKFPMILGNDVSGLIVKVGENVTKFKSGDEVYGMIDSNNKKSITGFAKGGSYAEYCVTREDTLDFLPKMMDRFDAASVPLASLTAYQGLKKVNPKKGQKILINGASGGVGIFAVQFSKLFGMNVTAVSSGIHKEFLLSIGSDSFINYKKNDFKKGNVKYDIIFDVVANTTYKECKNVLGENGLFISNVAKIKPLIKNFISPIFSVFTYKNRDLYNWVESSGKDLSEITKMIDEGQIKTFVSKQFKLTEAREAHSYFDYNSVRGKIILINEVESV